MRCAVGKSRCAGTRPARSGGLARDGVPDGNPEVAAAPPAVRRTPALPRSLSSGRSAGASFWAASAPRIEDHATARARKTVSRGKSTHAQHRRAALADHRICREARAASLCVTCWEGALSGSSSAGPALPPGLMTGLPDLDRRIWRRRQRGRIIPRRPTVHGQDNAGDRNIAELQVRITGRRVPVEMLYREVDRPGSISVACRAAVKS